MNKVKIVVHVPLEVADIMRKTLAQAGAGLIGKYSDCSFSFVGIGRFTPIDGAQPTIGMIGQPEAVSEESIEVVCMRSDAKRILESLKAVHPYEEPAYEIYQLIDEDEL